MNLETFASASQNELVGWASDLADNFADGELIITDEAGISNEELIYVLAVYKLLDTKYVDEFLIGDTRFVGISNEELIYVLAVYKLLDTKNLFVKNSAFFNFAREAEAELRRRYTK